VTAAELVKRLVALVPPARLHLTSFHGCYAPNARLRPVVTAKPPTEAIAVQPATTSTKTPRLDWATLHARTFGTDVLRCPCGGRRTVRALYLTASQAELRLREVGWALPSRLLPDTTAGPQLTLAV
jgi:hypothetical protein